MTSHSAESASDVVIIYDGDCPYCSKYTHLLRIREAAGQVVLLNAREPSSEVRAAQAAGLDLNEGMVVRIGDQYYHGADAIHRLSLMSTRSGLMNRIAAATFRSKGRARLLYPALRFGRNLTLALLGRKAIARND